MKKALVIVGVLVGIVIVIGLYYIGTYNSIVAKKQIVEASWGQVQNNYQRRADLIPNLVEVVKGYAKHENSTLVAVTEARQQIQKLDVSKLANDPEAQKKFIEAQNSLSGALQRLLVVREAYPDLKANRNFLDLQAQLEGTENRITVARMDNQNAIKNYNTLVMGFFSSIVAQRNGFKTMEYFQADQVAQTAPKVSF